MRHRDEIFSDICLSPQRNDVRLEFADAIQAQDSTWARHIRDAIAADARGGPIPYVPDELQDRLRASLREYGDVGCMFDRGFVNTVIMTPDVFIANGERILNEGPILELGLQILQPSIDSWNLVLPELAQCPALARVTHLTIWGTPDFDEVSMQHIIRSPHLDRLIRLTTPESFRCYFRDAADAEAEAEMWSLLFESRVFRRMIDWGLGLLPHRRGPIESTVRTMQCFGDSLRVEKPESDYYELTTYDPMPTEDRALEEKYGYIPRLHANNWDATVLDVLRGKKPDFPAGSRPVPEMYAVPPPKNQKVGSDY